MKCSFRATVTLAKDYVDKKQSVILLLLTEACYARDSAWDDKMAPQRARHGRIRPHAADFIIRDAVTKEEFWKVTVYHDRHDAAPESLDIETTCEKVLTDLLESIKFDLLKSRYRGGYLKPYEYKVEIATL